MKKWMYILLLMTVILSACSSQATENIKGIEDTSLKQLISHKNTLLGNNGDVSAILNDLPGGVIHEFEIVNKKALKVTYGVKEGASVTQKQFDAFWFDQKDIVEKTYLYNAIALFILVDNVQQVTLQMSSSDEPSVTFKRKQLEKKLPHSFKEYKDNQKLWQKELVDGVVESTDKRQTLYKVFPMKK